MKMLAIKRLMLYSTIVAIFDQRSKVDASVSASLDDPSLPWGDLIEKLSPTASLIEASNHLFAEQCDPGFDIHQDFRSDDIVHAESGLCLNSYVCAFQNCLPIGQDDTASVTENLSRIYYAQYEDVMDWKDPCNPNYGLPSSVLFPANAGDIVAAVQFANDNNIELSVKSSGHNYASQSSKKDTLLLNTVRFKKYAATGIVECDADTASDIIESDLSNQPCILSLAKNKNGYIRVATGEPFVDVYQAVHDYNEAQDEYKFHAIGGAHPSVTPMGWTLQGGMAGTQMGRQLGFGVDQVLQIEAVLPTGEHVRFGPTSFEDAEGYLVPRTTAVSGVCNTNPSDPEELWIWEACEKDINFDDLWFAFRGGGGGTYGIVTTIYLQLHDYLPLELVAYHPSIVFDGCVTSEEDLQIIQPLYQEFLFDFLIDPSSIGVSTSESSACGRPTGDILLECYGDGAGQRFIAAWKDYLLKPTDPEFLMDKNISESLLTTASGCFEGKLEVVPDYVTQVAEAETLLGPSVFTASTDFNAFPDFFIYPGSMVGLPLDFTLKIKDIIVQADPASLYHAVGGYEQRFAHDQTSSFPESIRNAAAYVVLPNGPIEGIPDLISLANISDAYNISSTDSTIPGYLGPNHMLAYAYGPLKSDPTQMCDFDNFTFEEAEEKCYSAQEAVWGSEVLARLEAIKAAVDPNHILNCFKCVGYKGSTFEAVPNGQCDSTSAPAPTDEEEPPAPTEEQVSSTDTTPASGGFRIWSSMGHLVAHVVLMLSFMAFA